MQRREILKTVAGAVAVAMVAPALAATEGHEHHHDHGGGKPFAGVIDTSSDCLKTGEACLAHCLVLLGQGDKERRAVPSQSMSCWRPVQP